MSRYLLRLMVLGGAFGVVQGCSQLPLPSAPVVAAAPAFKEARGQAAKATAVLSQRWWTLLADDELDRLQEQLNQASPDLAAALARHEQALAGSEALRAAQAPTVSTATGVQRNQQSERRPLRVLGPTSPDRYNSATLELDVSYEVDLWGRVRKRVAAGDAEARAAQADLVGARLSLQAQLADQWLALKSTDAELQLLRETVQSQARSVELVSARHQRGLVSGLDLARAQGLEASARSQIEQALARRAQLEHAIAALVGANPSEFSIEPRRFDFTLPEVPVTLPSELLLRRSDIRAAQGRVNAALHSVGVARTAFYPSLTLAAQGGFQSSDLGRFMETPNIFWALGPGLAATLFDGGRRQAEQRRAEAALDEVGQRYRATVLGAFQQVEDQLALMARYSESAAHEHAAAVAAQRAWALADQRYRGGLASYLEVVAAQVSNLQARRSELDLQTRYCRAAVQLIRALGGAWSQPTQG